MKKATKKTETQKATKKTETRWEVIERLLREEIMETVEDNAVEDNGSSFSFDDVKLVLLENLQDTLVE